MRGNVLHVCSPSDGTVSIALDAPSQTLSSPSVAPASVVDVEVAQTYVALHLRHLPSLARVLWLLYEKGTSRVWKGRSLASEETRLSVVFRRGMSPRHATTTRVFLHER